jgi:hypothetical protein
MDTPTDTPTDTPVLSRWSACGKKVGATALVAAGLVAGSVGVAAAATSSGTGSSGPGTPPAQGPGAMQGPGGMHGPGGPSGMHGPGGMHGRGGAGGPGGPGGREATVQRISGSSLVVTTATGKTITYTLTGSTTYRKDGAAATSAAVNPGELVIVRTDGPPPGAGSDASGSSSSGSATTPTATEVDVVSPHVAGLVQSVSTSGGSTTIVVADAQGFWHTIVTSGSTTYTQDGSSVTSPTITDGEFVAADGTIASDHTTLDAATVRIGAPTPAAGAPGSGAAGSSNSNGGATGA